MIHLGINTTAKAIPYPFELRLGEELLVGREEIGGVIPTPPSPGKEDGQVRNSRSRRSNFT